jgi:hypothetical protein
MPAVLSVCASSLLALQRVSLQAPTLRGESGHRYQLYSDKVEPSTNVLAYLSAKGCQVISGIFADHVVAYSSQRTINGSRVSQADGIVFQEQPSQFFLRRFDDPVIREGLVDPRPSVVPITACSTDHVVTLAPQPFGKDFSVHEDISFEVISLLLLPMEFESRFVR